MNNSEYIFRSNKVLMNESKKLLQIKDINQNNENNENKLFIDKTIENIKYIFNNLPNLPDFLININKMDNCIHEIIYIEIVGLFQKNKFNEENIKIIKNKYFISDNFILQNVNLIIEYYEKLYLDDDYYSKHHLNLIYHRDYNDELFI
jgi:hypothetical protein